jgi:hypothetical protein
MYNDAAGAAKRRHGKEEWRRRVPLVPGLSLRYPDQA